MEPISQTYLTKRRAELVARAEDVLGQVVTTFHRGGHYRTAASLTAMLRAARGETPVTEDPLPGLTAALHLAGREQRDPQVMLPGERVRITFSDGAPSITGIWCYDEPSGEWPVGRPYVLRDDNGDRFDVGGGWQQVRPLWFDLDRRDRDETVRRAVTVIASAWAEDHLMEQVDVGGELTHDDIDYDHSVTGSHSQTERQRHCPCGELAVLRVTAWAEVPAREVIGEQASTEWSKPEEYGSQTVCSDTCAERWTIEFHAKSIDLLGEDIADILQWNLEDWAYTPRWDDLPDVLARSRDSAASSTTALMDAAKAWFDGDYGQAGQHVSAARTALTIALVYLAELDEPYDLLPSSGGTHPREIGYEAWLQMAAPLVAQIRDDPHRYEIHGGGDRVYDRQLDQWHDGRTGRHTTRQHTSTADTTAPSTLLLDDGLCGDCLSGRCHGDSTSCGCDRHAASVQARDKEN